MSKKIKKELQPFADAIMEEIEKVVPEAKDCKLVFEEEDLK